MYNLVTTRASTQEINPKPYIRAFESTIDELLKLRKKVTAKIEDIEDEMAASETSRKQTLADIANSFEVVQSSLIRSV